MSRFTPDRFAGDLQFFVATEEPAGVRRSPDEWASFVSGRIERHEIPCKHLELGQPVHIKTIGRLLDQNLRASAS